MDIKQIDIRALPKKIKNWQLRIKKEEEGFLVEYVKSGGMYPVAFIQTSLLKTRLLMEKYLKSKKII